MIKYLGRVLPRSGRDPAAAAALLEGLADRALRSEFEPVLCLEAPEPAEVPRSLLRADGRSIYQRHGGVRYATGAQLAMEERMLAQASAERRAAPDPRASRARARRGPRRSWKTRSPATRTDTHDQRTRTGLREDQAAAALSVLTDGKRVSVINAPAGSGKTRVLAEAARAWTAAGLGPVIGITPSQSARNTLAAGVPVSYNSAQFLGHLPGRRGARGPIPISPGTLLVIDEASMITGPDLADLIAYAEARGAKMILAGDTQPAAGGGKRRRHGPARQRPRLRPARRTRPVPRRLGTARQPAAARRRHHRPGRLRPARPDLRRGTGADDGRRRGRLRRAHPRRHRHPADGRRPRAAPRTSTAASATTSSPSGIVQDGPAVTIADGTKASPGDLIICHPERPHRRGGRARPDAGQRRPAPHRGRHPQTA